MTQHRITVYEDKQGQWRWRKRPTQGGDIVADSGEGYTRKDDAFESATNEAGPGDSVDVESSDDPR